MKRRAYYFCQYVPVELLCACGLTPERIMAPATINSESEGEEVIGAESCFWCRSVISKALKVCERETNPIFIGATTCDQSRRAFEVLSANKNIISFMLNMPATTSLNALELYSSELNRLEMWLSSHTGVELTESELSNSCASWAEQRGKLKSLRSSLPANELLLRATALLEGEQLETAEMKTNDMGLAVIVTGAPLSSSHAPLVELIENLGARVASIATCTGDRFAEVDTDSSIRTISELANRYFNAPPCIWRRPNDSYYSWLKEKIEQTNAAGVILIAPTFCDLWNCERERIKSTVSVPVLQLELTASEITSARNTMRIEAFLESLS